MAKFILQIPSEVIQELQFNGGLYKLQDNLKDFIECEGQGHLILPSDEGWVTSFDGEGKVDSWEIRVGNSL